MALTIASRVIARRPSARRVWVVGAAVLLLAAAHAGDGGRSSPARTPRATTRVTAIYPTVARVPANLLKLYIEFSAPMSDGEAEQRLHLFDARGHEMPHAFLQVDAELWNDTHTRLTVLFDPGRIKRGLRANLEEGAPLIEGETFRLAIDPAWRNGQGVPLTNGFERMMTVGPADRTSPDWRRWTVAAPTAGTRAAVTVRFDKPLDRALLDRWIVVVDASPVSGLSGASGASGATLPGRAMVGPDQASWSFIPENAWRADHYQVLVNPQLEDLAGNTLVSLFDAEMASQPRRNADTPIALPFTPHSAPVTPHTASRSSTNLLPE